MENQKVMKINNLINYCYNCGSFVDFLKLTILNLHELLMYDSGMFFCGISRDCSFFKPYINGDIESFYKKQSFSQRDTYLLEKGIEAGKEALVYKSSEYAQGIVRVSGEPRSDFLVSQEDFYIACMRIIYKDQFMGEIYLHRSHDKLDFDEEDMFILRLLQPHVSTVFHIIHTLNTVKDLEAENSRSSKKGLCLFDSELSLLAGNVTGLDMLKATTVFGSSILYHIKELCEDILAESVKGVSLMQRTASLKTVQGMLLVDIVYQQNEKVKREARFYVLMELESKEQVIADYRFKFTKREADIIDGIIQGKNNAQLANRLHLSENTIKTHVQNIYRKVGANNRTELAYILLLNKN